ncbi:MAG: hypothetical protein U1E13_14260 [Methylophilaceae bacterium]|nr:hypothetical protein [Methylophilaceae bacterium]
MNAKLNAVPALSESLISVSLTQDQAETVLIALMALDSILTSNAKPETRYQALTELVHAHVHFGSQVDLSQLVSSFDRQRSGISLVIDKIDPDMRSANELAKS